MKLLVTTVTEVSPSRFVVCRRSGDRRAAIRPVNPGGPEGDTVTVAEKLLNTEYCHGNSQRVPDREEPGKPRTARTPDVAVVICLKLVFGPCG